MQAWVIRAGKVGEREDWCLTNGFAGGGFTEIDDLSQCSSRDDVKLVYQRCRPADKPARASTNSAQLWILRGRVVKDDLVVMPFKSGSKQIAIGRCTSGYQYLSSEPQTQRHVIKVEWLRTDIPRAAVKQDLLYILGSALSFFGAKRNDAPWRLQQLLATGVDPGSRPAGADSSEDSDSIDHVAEVEGVDVLEAARDVIRNFIIENFKGHKLAELTAAILEARGLTCVVSPPGPDQGIDITAGSGPLGLDAPRIVVQCKSEVGAVGSEVVQKLLGALGGITEAQQGLLVAFGGITGPARQLLNNHQFRIKVWDSDRLIDNLLAVFERLRPDIAAELPLQRVWTLGQLAD